MPLITTSLGPPGFNFTIPGTTITIYNPGPPTPPRPNVGIALPPGPIGPGGIPMKPIVIDPPSGAVPSPTPPSDAGNTGIVPGLQGPPASGLPPPSVPPGTEVKPGLQGPPGGHPPNPGSGVDLGGRDPRDPGKVPTTKPPTDYPYNKPIDNGPAYGPHTGPRNPDTDFTPQIRINWNIFTLPFRYPIPLKFPGGMPFIPGGGGVVPVGPLPAPAPIPIPIPVGAIGSDTVGSSNHTNI